MYNYWFESILLSLESRDAHIKRLFTLMFGVAILAFVYGFLSSRKELFPYSLIYRAHVAFVDLRDNWKSTVGMRPTRWLVSSRKNGSGVTMRLNGLYQPGYILISSLFNSVPSIRLINTDGHLIAAWNPSFRSLWSKQEQEFLGLQPAHDWDVGLMGAIIDPDGSVIFTFNSGGLVKLDRCGKLIWKRRIRTHHSIFRAEDGSLWVPGTKAVYSKSTEIKHLGLFRSPLREDSIMHLSSDGRVIGETSIPGLFLRNGLQSILLANGELYPSNSTEDYFHLNSVAILPHSLVKQFPKFDQGDVLFSLRNINLIAVANSKMTLIKWYQIGPWMRQHDPGFDINGKIILYDNNTDSANQVVNNGSKILLIDPVTRKTTLKYKGTLADPFYSDIEGTVRRLNNGNLLISEAMAGRIFQITPDGKIAWEYINRYDANNVVAETNAYGLYPPTYFSMTDWSCKKT